MEPLLPVGASGIQDERTMSDVGTHDRLLRSLLSVIFCSGFGRVVNLQGDEDEASRNSRSYLGGMVRTLSSWAVASSHGLQVA